MTNLFQKHTKCLLYLYKQCVGGYYRPQGVSNMFYKRQFFLSVAARWIFMSTAVRIKCTGIPPKQPTNAGKIFILLQNIWVKPQDLASISIWHWTGNCKKDSVEILKNFQGHRSLSIKIVRISSIAKKYYEFRIKLEYFLSHEGWSIFWSPKHGHGASVFVCSTHKIWKLSSIEIFFV